MSYVLFHVFNILGAVRVGHVDGEVVINPTRKQLMKSQLNLVIASTKDSKVGGLDFLLFVEKNLFQLNVMLFPF